jgi:hypothetical protein
MDIDVLELCAERFFFGEQADSLFVVTFDSYGMVRIEFDIIEESLE